LVLLLRTASTSGVWPSGPGAFELAPDFKRRRAALNWFLVTAKEKKKIMEVF
jgi:hypothetical protein